MKTNLSLLRLLFIFLFTSGIMTVYAQDVQVNGKVNGQDGIPLPGVNIVVKGTTIGSITDLEGNYSISPPNLIETLVFSYVGYVTQEISLDGQTEINVTLIEDITGLEEVVVIGYGTVKKSDLTGAVSVVKTEDLESQPSSKISDVLQGRVAGLQIVKSSDEPNAGATVRIRGASSFSGSNSPLVVIDGFPFSNNLGDLKQINPDNIESIEVLKDASASAIYGSQGANGVILITTKTGSEGKSEIYVRNQLTFSQFDSKFNTWRDPAAMAFWNNQFYINGGFPPLYVGAVNTGIYYPSVDDIQDGKWRIEEGGEEIYSFTDWTKEVFRDVPVTENITIGANGGNERTKYHVSLNYWDQQGNVKGNDFDKYNAFVTLDQKLSKNVSVKFNTHITVTDVKNATGTEFSRNPLWPVYNENDPSKGYYRTGGTDNGNPVQRREMITNQTNTMDLIASGMLNWEIIPGLTFNSNFSYKYGTSVSDQYTPDTLNITYDGVGTVSNYLDHKLSSENFLTYQKQFGIHNLSVMGGWTVERFMYRTSSITGRDFISDALRNESLNLSNPENRVISNNLVETGLESVYGRLNYSFNNKYLFTFTSRADGSTKFGANNKWGFFPSGALSWKLHQEDFIANLGIFSELKSRISYGLTGNQGVSPYQTLARYGEELFYDGASWHNVIGPGYGDFQGRFTYWWGVPSRDLKWETTSQMNLGLDMGMLNNRLQVNFDYYFKHTTDLIRRKILPPSSAFDYMSVNDGVIDNKGIELLVNYRAISTADFTFTPTVTFSRNRNTVVDIGTAADAGLVEDTQGLVYLAGRNDLEWYFGSNLVSVYAIDKPMLSFYGYRTDGVVQTLEEGLAAGLQGFRAEPGQMKYVDINEDGVVDDQDREIIGNPEPDFMGSLNLEFRYKNFDLSVFMYGVYGNDILDAPKGGRPSQVPYQWTPDNPNNEWPKHEVGQGWPLVSDFFIVDGSYLRLQNLSAGYTTSIPKMKLTRLRVYVNFNNLYTITGFDGYDPEVGIEGINWGGKPRLRTATLGINVTF